MPVWVDIPGDAKLPGGIERMMITHDTGAAIRGVVRGDARFELGEELAVAVAAVPPAVTGAAVVAQPASNAINTAASTAAAEVFRNMSPPLDAGAKTPAHGAEPTEALA